MTKELSLIRISKENQARLKQRANMEGRTLEWSANAAVEFYLKSFDEELHGLSQETLKRFTPVTTMGTPAAKAGMPPGESFEPVIVPDDSHAEPVVDTAVPTKSAKSYEFCTHNQLKGFCRKGCK